MDLLAHRGISKHCSRITPKGNDLRVPYTEDQLVAMFKSSDTNKDGRLSKHELNKLFKKLGSRFSYWRVFRALHHADANGDGYVSEEEFSNLVGYILNKCDYGFK